MIRAIIFDCFGVLTVPNAHGQWAANEPLFATIRQLKPQVKLGILSNSGADQLDQLIGTDNKLLFDDILLSYRIGASKPDRAAFETAALYLDVTPEECVFIDDSEEYVRAAEHLGMKGHTYRTATETIQFCKTLTFNTKNDTIAPW